MGDTIHCKAEVERIVALGLEEFGIEMRKKLMRPDYFFEDNSMWFTAKDQWLRLCVFCTPHLHEHTLDCSADNHQCIVLISSLGGLGWLGIDAEIFKCKET